MLSALTSCIPLTRPQVLNRTLKAPRHLQYQLAFVSSELREIFAKAPAIPSEAASTEDKDGRRKPLEDDCPICCCEFEPTKEEIVYCKAACGNNIHKECFNQWAATKHGEVTCPFCRSPWQQDLDESLARKHAKSGKVNAEGYVNVADQLGISRERGLSIQISPKIIDGLLTFFARLLYLP